jgi:hypothetical protein
MHSGCNTSIRIKGTAEGNTPKLMLGWWALSYDIEPLQSRDEGCGMNRASSHSRLGSWVCEQEASLTGRKDRAHLRCCMMDGWSRQLLCYEPGVTPSHVSTSRLLRESGALWWLPKISLPALAAARKPYYCGISNSHASAVSPRRLCSLLHRLLLPCTKHQLPGSIAALQHDAPVTPNSKGTSAITVCVFAECLSRQSL